jgi:integrase
MSNSTATTLNGKPAKPYPDFPLFPHMTRRWAKKIRGKLHYFGPWADWQAALKKYQEQKDDLHAGRTPGVQGDGLTVRELLNRFLTSKKLLVDAGELATRTFSDYRMTCDRISASFGLTRLVEDLADDDFEKLRAQTAKTYGPVALGNEIQRIRCVFKYGYDAGLIDKPIRFGPAFRRPGRKTLRRARHAKGVRMFEADELRQILEAANVQMKAMILLGVNCGFGNADCGTLPLSALDLDNGWVNYPRPKTGIPRRCPLWPETVAALRRALDTRPTPKNEVHRELVFITKQGGCWWKPGRLKELVPGADLEGGRWHDPPDNPLSKELAKILKELKMYRPGLNFYALRHTFETIGRESRDQVAVDHIMRHVRDDMASVYRERISDERLRAVTDHVRAWL